MTRNLLLLVLFITSVACATAQDVIVKWTFPNNNLSDTIQNGSLALNQNAVVSTTGTAAITMTNGQTTGDYAATATGWNDGAGTKSWNISFKTTGYNSLKISAKLRAGGNNGGPKDFKMQYKIGNDDSWTDVPGGIVTAANNWTGGVISNLSLPDDCSNQQETVSIRWLMVSNTDVNGGTVTASGISKIDEINVTGFNFTGTPEYFPANQAVTFPNPASGPFTVKANVITTKIKIYDLQGNLIRQTDRGHFGNQSFEIEKPGCYLIHVESPDGVQTIRQIVR